MKRLTTIAIAVAATLTLAACATGDQTLGGADQTGTTGSTSDGVVIGSADFTESQLIATIYSQALQDAGVEVREQFNIGSREVYLTALQDGSIDVIPEYAGALLKFFDPESEASTIDDVIAGLETTLPAGLVHLDPSPAENNDTLTVTGATAQQYGLATISDLASHAGEFALGGPPEWVTRATGVPGLERVYGLTFKEYVTLDAGGPLTLTALLNGQIQVGNVFSTDPAIAANGLVMLDDDRSLFPAENVVPVVAQAKADDTVTSTLDAISAVLTTDDLMAMNQRIADGDDMRQVATDWLETAGI